MVTELLTKGRAVAFHRGTPQTAREWAERWRPDLKEWENAVNSESAHITIWNDIDDLTLFRLEAEILVPK